MSFEGIDQTLIDQFFTRIAIDETKGLVEQIIYLPIQFASAGHLFPWLIQTQSLIHSFAMEANKIILSLKLGKDDATCIPSLRPLMFKEVSYDAGFVKLVVEGLGGLKSLIQLVLAGAHQIDFQRTALPSKRGKKEEVLTCTAYYPVLNKVTIGLDDTDTSAIGDTYLTALNVGQQIESEGWGHFLKLTVTFNYPRNPFKTTNNAASAMTFLVDPPKTEQLITTVIDKAQRATNSRETGIAILEGLIIPPSLKRYANHCKGRMVQVGDAEHTAKAINARLVSFDRDRGKIGALASLGYANEPQKAIIPSLKFRTLFKLGNSYVKVKEMF